MDLLPHAPPAPSRPALRPLCGAWLTTAAVGLSLGLSVGLTPASAREPAHDKPAAQASGKALSLDELRDKLADRVAQVREAQQARESKAGEVPVLRVTVKTSGHGPAADVDAHGAAPADKPHRIARVAPPAARAAKPAATAHAPSGHGGLPHWSYQGADGPEGWAELAPEFATCARGQRQSPIDIREGIRVELDPLRFDYQPVPFGVIDNGHTIQVNVAPGNAIEVNGRRFDLVQFHFHRPSEERINGRQFDMDVHLVHKDPQGRLAVVAVLIQQGRQHPLVQAIWNNLPLEKNEEQRALGTLDLTQLLPEDRRYYTYMGSLTTPPCSEGVLWMVFKQPVTVAPEQLAIFSRLYPMNARPIQPASNRLIKESN
ncbi:carbonic anhydrase [Sphaerotilus mobilis]|uniref:carbonic anhydrase n=1 Tax=Sphaerotilus mobilis TaxID=47994 RepID=A0A4V2EYK5_9BURK|nr:carbonic anhydrase family protein [Sphaerotilus mobilis]RZS63310.1 carbonic anhydrase [Sphaerotilus mobilis]